MYRKLIGTLVLLTLMGCSNINSQKKVDREDKTPVMTQIPIENQNKLEEIKKENPEMRGVWIASVVNINWPRTVGTGKKVMEEQKKEFIKLLDGAVDMNMNAVFVQIRPTADTFYRSSYEPWSKYLTGLQGKFPGWDPLKFMIEESHKRGLEFHAWFNPYRVTLKVDDAIIPTHPANQNLEWTFKYGGKIYYNPGVPEAMEYSIDNIMEVVKNYDIDGVHMDDYFYPYPLRDEKLPDWKTYLKYGKKNFKTAADWRRNNVDTFIEKLSREIKETKPNVKFGISPFGVWRNDNKDETGSNTRASIGNYDDLYADTRKWIKEGWIDYIAPQIYWNQGFRVAEYNILVDWWAKEVRGTGVELYIGHAAYKVGSKSWTNEDELLNQIKYNREVEEVDGSIFFNIDSLLNNPQNIRTKLKETLYSEKVNVK